MKHGSYQYASAHIPRLSIKAYVPNAVKQLASSVFFHSEIQYSREVYRFLHCMKRRDSSTENLVNHFRQDKLQQIIRHAYLFCPYYHNLFEERGISEKNLNDFQRIPFLTKQLIIDCYDDIVSRNIKRLRTFHFTTGGSTGEPLGFPITRLCGFMDRVHQLFHLEQIGYTPGDRIHAFDGTSVPQYYRDRNVYWGKKGPGELPYGSIHYSSLYVRRCNIHHYIRMLLRLKPDFLRGYPSFLSEIADFILSENIDAKGFVKGVVLTAEQAFDWQVEKIQTAFETRVYFQYGHSEMCVFAYTDDESSPYTCSPFYGHVEVLDENGNHVSVGESGEVVVTGFHNTALPFIRYKTGDMAVYAGTEYGITLLKRIEGRSQDYVYRNDGERVPITAVVFGQHFGAFRNIRKWQLRQRRLGEVEINVVRGPNYTPEDEFEIVKKIEAVGGIKAHVNYVETLELSGRGKVRFVVVQIDQR